MTIARRLSPLILALAACSAAEPRDVPADAAVADAAVADAAVADAGADLAPLCGVPACTAGMLCETARGCCSCGPFARACLPGWTCAVPSANDARCPAAPPASLAACSLPDKVACWYCAGKPIRAACVGADVWSSCHDAGHARCWVLAGPTQTCD